MAQSADRIATGRYGPDKLVILDAHGFNKVAPKLEAWKHGVWYECLVSPERNAELLAQYPPEKEWGRPGILAKDMLTLMREVSGNR